MEGRDGGGVEGVNRVMGGWEKNVDGGWAMRYEVDFYGFMHYDCDDIGCLIFLI